MKKTKLSVWDLPYQYGKFWVGEFTQYHQWVDEETAELILLEYYNGVTDGDNYFSLN